MTPRPRSAIVGAGPAGLTLAQLLQTPGIESVVLENRSRDYVEQRIRAGVLEQGTVDLLRADGAGERHATARASSTTASSCSSTARATASPLSELTGGASDRHLRPDRGGQGSDRAAARRRRAAALRGRRRDACTTSKRPAPRSRSAHEGARARARVRRDRRLRRLPRRLPAVDPDGRAAARSSASTRSAGSASWPTSRRRTTSWSTPTIARGFALLSLRSPTLSRAVPAVRARRGSRRVARRPDLGGAADPARRSTGWTLAEGPILEKGVTGMRSFVAEPMQHGRLFLAGDAAHIVPPTGAKGLNLAIADVRVLARGDRRAGTRRRPGRPRRLLATRACGGCGGPSTSRGG